MIDEVLVLNSTPTGILQNSGSGSMVIDAALDARLVKRLMQALTQSMLKVRVATADDLPVTDHQLLVVSRPVAAVLDLQASARALIYPEATGLTAAGMTQLAVQIDQRLTKISR